MELTGYDDKQNNELVDSFNVEEEVSNSLSSIDKLSISYSKASSPLRVARYVISTV